MPTTTVRVPSGVAVLTSERRTHVVHLRDRPLLVPDGADVASVTLLSVPEGLASASLFLGCERVARVGADELRDGVDLLDAVLPPAAPVLAVDGDGDGDGAAAAASRPALPVSRAYYQRCRLEFEYDEAYLRAREASHSADEMEPYLSDEAIEVVLSADVGPRGHPFYPRDPARCERHVAHRVRHRPSGRRVRRVTSGAACVVPELAIRVVPGVDRDAAAAMTLFPLRCTRRFVPCVFAPIKGGVCAGCGDSPESLALLVEKFGGTTPVEGGVDEFEAPDAAAQRRLFERGEPFVVRYVNQLRFLEGLVSLAYYAM